MIEDHWMDLTCYHVNFTNCSGSIFCRAIAIPPNFPEEKISLFFKSHFRRQEIEVINIVKMNELLIPRQVDSLFMKYKEIDFNS